jgi:Uncharacterized conserved protein
LTMMDMVNIREKHKYALKEMKNDGRVNVVGHISEDEMFLLDFIKPWSSFKFIESDEL